MANIDLEKLKAQYFDNYLNQREKIEFDKLTETETMRLLFINDMYHKSHEQRKIIDQFCFAFSYLLANPKDLDNREKFKTICMLMDDIVKDANGRSY